MCISVLTSRLQKVGLWIDYLYFDFPSVCLVSSDVVYHWAGSLESLNQFTCTNFVPQWYRIGLGGGTCFSCYRSSFYFWAINRSTIWRDLSKYVDCSFEYEIAIRVIRIKKVFRKRYIHFRIRFCCVHGWLIGYHTFILKCWNNCTSSNYCESVSIPTLSLAV